MTAGEYIFKTRKIKIMIRKLLSVVVTLLISQAILYANWEIKSFEFEGQNRQYRIYFPEGYSESKSYSLVVGLHGLWGNMHEFPNVVSDFHRIADTADIILVYPQGLDNPPPLGTGWNSSAGMLGLYPSDNINDVGFINAVTDSMQANYPIIKEQTYLFGFSNGGFMAQKIACEANERYAGIASIAGTLGNKINYCNPERKVPIIHFHGTFDVNVSYFNPPMGRSVSALMGLWSKNYNCSGREIIKVPDTVADGYNIEHYVYKDCDERLEHFKVYNAFHILLNKGYNDISYPEEMWRFFRYQKDTSVATSISSHRTNQIKIYPVPANDRITIELPTAENHRDLVLDIRDYTGKQIAQLAHLPPGIYHYDCKNLPNGIYLVNITDGKQYFSQKFIIAR